MNTKSETPHIFLLWLFLAFALLGTLLRVFNISNLLCDWDAGDEATYALVARSLMFGDWPYHGAFDHKPIGLYYLFALFFQVFGYSLEAVRLMPFVAIGLSCWLLYKIAKIHLPPSRHLLAFAAIAFMVTCTSFGNGGHVSNSEILQMPAFAGWWLAAWNAPQASWRRPLLMGALAGLAAQINYLGGFVLCLATALLLAWPLFSQVSRAALVAFVADGVLALAAFVVMAVLALSPLIASGDLAQYFAMQSGALGGYQGVLNDDKLVRAVVSIGISAGFVVALVACIYGGGGRSSFRLEDAAVRQLTQVAAVFGLTLFAIWQTKRLYPHYFNLLIVPSTLALLLLLGRAGARSIRMYVFCVGALAMLLVARGAWDVFLKDWQDGFKQQHEIARLGAEIRRHAQPGQRVLLLNMDQTLYFLTDVVPATRFVFRGQIFSDRFLSGIGSSLEREMAVAMAHRPVFVMSCFDGVKAEHRSVVAGALAVGYAASALAGFEDCEELRTYVAVGG